MNKLNILFVADSLEIVGGAEVSTRDQIHLLNKKGAQISFLTSGKSKSSTVDEIDIYENKYKGFFFKKSSNNFLRNYRGLINLKALFAMQRAVSSFKPNMIIFNNISSQASYSLILYAKFKGINTVHILRDTMSLTGGKFFYSKTKDIYKINYFDELKRARLRFNPLKPFFTKYCLNRLDVLISISHELKRFFNYHGIKVDQVIHNGVIEKISDAGTLNQYSKSSKKFIFWPSRYSKFKGGHQIIKAFNLIDDGNIDLIITADKNDIKDKEILDLIDRSNNIYFTGWISKEDINGYMLRADLILYPSLYLEPFGRVPVEAMSFKKPVIVSSYGGLPEIIKDGYNGYVVDPFNLEDFSKKIKKIIYDKKLNRDIGINGYKEYKNSFTGDKMINEYYNILINLITENE